MSKTNGGPAFPAIKIVSGDNYNPPRQYHLPGMSLRDYFAAKAMQSHIAALSTAMLPDWNAEISRLSYLTADAMLKAREEGGAE